MTEQPNDPGLDLILAGRYRIDPDQPLPQFDTATSSAVAATDQRAPARGLTASICKPGLIPRLDIIPQLARLARLPLINPIEAGPVMWPQTGGRRYVVLFERISGEPLMRALSDEFQPLREDQVLHRVIQPIMPALKELGGRSIKHRAIRADNVFYADQTRQSTVLGECVSGPPGMSQPALYEPIDAAMAGVSGRGQGTLADDVYAFGVLIAILLNGRNPAEGMSDEELIATKIQTGSYATLAKDLRLSLRMVELLRGLLCDDPKERWTVADIELWDGGRQLSPKQPMLPVKANRTIAFAEAEYLTRASLSHAMGCQWREAGNLLTSGEVVNWLKRSFGDEENANAIQSLSGTSGPGQATEDRLISGALVILDPTHPLRYREISARIDGFAIMLAVNYGDEKFRKSFAEMMAAKLPQMYLQSVGGKGHEQVPMMKMFDMINHFIESPQIGNGLERALYETNRGWPCHSPLIAEDYVCELDDLLPALERAARRGAVGERLIDRHIAAFCSARSKTLADCVRSLVAPTGDKAREALGILTLYAEVQRVTGASRRYPAVTAWLAATMTPVVESYHNRLARDRLNNEVERVGGKGSPAALLAVLDNPETRHADKSGFAGARIQYGRLENSINWLAAGGLAAPEHVLAKSRQAATLVSAVIAGVTVVLMTILFVA